MATGKIAMLVESLLKKSRERSIVWKATPDVGTFIASFPKQSVAVLPYVDADGAEEIKIQLFNSDGIVIEDILPSDYTSIFQDAYQMLREIYTLARANAMGVDTAVDEILSFLDKARPY